MRTLLLVLALSLGANAPAAEQVVAPSAPPVPPPTRETLVRRLTGSFSNLNQARSDFSYHTVALHSCEIWSERIDGPWFYLEQSLEDAPGVPYRQQVYQFTVHSDGGVTVQVYGLADPVAWTGVWKDPSKPPAAGPDGLRLAEACTIALAAQSDGSLKGQTEGCACRSELRNADYAKTDLTISDSSLVVWDRGFSAKNIQVWGPSHGGFEFRRVDQ
ncbi:MAG TPA: chromophore lyase CpcT/CpeT [Candidatus Didemnitutus sp.]|nr:chromophore lyase CpcT/CpeT [Candidatus Didemnitutus sp.]